MILQLQRRHVEVLKQETERVYPVEACAMLFGELSKNEAAVEKVELTQNRLRSSTRFEVDPAKVAVAVTKAEKEGYVFIGLFHSHPAPATPSSVDLKYMRFWGGHPLANPVFNRRQTSRISTNRRQGKGSNYKNRIESLGINIVLGVKTSEILGKETVTGPIIDNRNKVSWTLVLVSAGMRSNTELDLEAGI